MNLQNTIAHYRRCLAALPDGILYGQIPEGANHFSAELSALLSAPHQAFLSLCNGGTFGDIVLWSAEALWANQYRVPAEARPFVYELGQVLYEPLLLDRQTGRVHFNVDREVAVPFETFIKEYIFGSSYQDLYQGADADDMWHSFVRAHKPAAGQD